jgi:hypothetical protein
VALDSKGFVLTCAAAGDDRGALEISRRGIYAISDIRRLAPPRGEASWQYWLISVAALTAAAFFAVARKHGSTEEDGHP